MISSGYAQDKWHYITDHLKFSREKLVLDNGKRFWGAKYQKLSNYTGLVSFIKIRAADVITTDLASDGGHGIRLRDHTHVTSAKFPDFWTTNRISSTGKSAHSI